VFGGPYGVFEQLARFVRLLGRGVRRVPGGLLGRGVRRVPGGPCGCSKFSFSRLVASLLASHPVIYLRSRTAILASRVAIPPRYLSSGAGNTVVRRGSAGRTGVLAEAAVVAAGLAPSRAPLARLARAAVVEVRVGCNLPIASVRHPNLVNTGVLGGHSSGAALSATLIGRC